MSLQIVLYSLLYRKSNTISLSTFIRMPTYVMCTKPMSSMKLVDWRRKNYLKCLQNPQNLHRTLVYDQSTAAESGGLCMLWSQCHSRPPGGETCTRGVPQCFREGEGGLCHCEEALNGNSWHQRSQLTTRTITYWTKKPMEKQHRIYVIGFWVTYPIHVFIVLLQWYD